jgi:CheY-like chemotaxis protein
MSTYPAAKKTILCIDNDQSVLRYEKALLERSGYAVLSAASAQQGLRLATMCHCDGVLLDYEIHGMNGHEVAVEIKRVRPEVMVILLSGSEVPRQALALPTPMYLSLKQAGSCYQLSLSFAAGLTK